MTMKSQAHSFEEKLLEFAYGELPGPEARALEAHLSGCPKCTEALGSIRGVRKTMGDLPAEPAPEAGLESLLAFAEQAARRMAAGPAPAPAWWRRWVAPLAGVTALAVVGVVALEVNKTANLAPAKAEYDVSRVQAGSDSAQAKVAAVVQAPSPARAAPTPGMAPAMAPPPPPADKPATHRLDGVSNIPGTFEAKRGLGLSVGQAAQGPRAEPASRAAEVQKKTAAKDVGGAFDKKGSLGAGANAEQALHEPKAEEFDQLYGASARPVPSAPPAQAARAALKTQAEAPAPSMNLSLRSAPAGQQVYGVSEGYSGGSGGSRSVATSAPSAPASEPESEVVTNSKLGGRGSSAYDDADRERQKGDELKGLLEKARSVSSSGNRTEEIRLAHQVLSQGAKGTQRLEALKRLCDAYLDTGRDDEAMPFCQAAVREFPRSGAAKLVQQRLNRPSPSVAAPPRKAKLSPPVFDEEAKKPAEKPAASPASTAPAMAH